MQILRIALAAMLSSSSVVALGYASAAWIVQGELRHAAAAVSNKALK